MLALLFAAPDPGLPALATLFRILEVGECEQCLPGVASNLFQERCS